MDIQSKTIIQRFPAISPDDSRFSMNKNTKNEIFIDYIQQHYGEFKRHRLKMNNVFMTIRVLFFFESVEHFFDYLKKK